MTTTSLNGLFNAVALAQGIEIDSETWRKGGPPAFTGQTGGHHSYGWSHAHKLEGSGAQALGYARAVIANYCARPSFYVDAPGRHSGYYKGGRPAGWTPETFDDVPRGDKAYVTSKGVALVSGPDLQHFWLDPLWAVIDNADDALTFKHPDGYELPAHWMARVAAQYLVKSIAGMVREYFKYVDGGRSTARIIDTFVQAGKRNLVDAEDAFLFLEWLEREGLPQLERAPGVNEVKGSGYCNWYQECGWMLLPLWELWPMLDDFGQDALAERVSAVRQRIGQWALDIEAVSTGSASRWEQLRIRPEMKKGRDGKALDSLAGVIEPDDLRGEWSYSLWSVTAMDVVRADHPGDESERLFQDTLKVASAEVGATPSKRVWLVDRNRNPI